MSAVDIQVRDAPRNNVSMTIQFRFSSAGADVIGGTIVSCVRYRDSAAPAPTTNLPTEPQPGLRNLNLSNVDFQAYQLAIRIEHSTGAVLWFFFTVTSFGFTANVTAINNKISAVRSLAAPYIELEAMTFNIAAASTSAPWTATFASGSGINTTDVDYYKGCQINRTGGSDGRAVTITAYDPASRVATLNAQCSPAWVGQQVNLTRPFPSNLTQWMSDQPFLVTSGLVSVHVATLASGALTSIVSAIWDALTATYGTVTGGFGKLLKDMLTASIATRATPADVTTAVSSLPSAATVAAAVWDEATAGHNSAGTFGERLMALPILSQITAIIPTTIAIASGVWANGVRTLTSFIPGGVQLLNAVSSKLTLRIGDSYATIPYAAPVGVLENAGWPVVDLNGASDKRFRVFDGDDVIPVIDVSGGEVTLAGTAPNRSASINVPTAETNKLKVSTNRYTWKLTVTLSGEVKTLGEGLVVVKR